MASRANPLAQGYRGFIGEAALVMFDGVNTELSQRKSLEGAFSAVVMVPSDLSGKEKRLREDYQIQRQQYQQMRKENYICMYICLDGNFCDAEVPLALREVICSCHGVFCEIHRDKIAHRCHK